MDIIIKSEDDFNKELETKKSIIKKEIIKLNFTHDELIDELADTAAKHELAHNMTMELLDKTSEYLDKIESLGKHIEVIENNQEIIKARFKEYITKMCKELHEAEDEIYTAYKEGLSEIPKRNAEKRHEENYRMKGSAFKWFAENYPKYTSISKMGDGFFSAKIEPIDASSTAKNWATEWVDEKALEWLHKNETLSNDDENIKSALINAKIAPIDTRKAGHLVKKWRTTPC